MGKFGAVLLAGAAAAALLPAAAQAQMETREGIALQNQILELRQEVQALSSQVASGAGGPPADYNRAPPRGGGGGADPQLTAQLLSRVQTLEDQVRSLRGRVDELQNQSGQQQQALAKQLGDLSFQMQQNGGRNAAPPSSSAPPTSYLQAPGGGGAAPPPTPSSPPSPPPRRTPELAMQEGNAALARRDYPTAESAAREVLNGGRGPRAYDAQFLLAQAQAGQHNFQAAAVAYDDTFNRNPTGARAQDSLVGLAGALLSLGDRGAACGALDKLRSQFSSTRADVREAAAGLRGRAGCG